MSESFIERFRPLYFLLFPSFYLTALLQSNKRPSSSRHLLSMGRRSIVTNDEQATMAEGRFSSESQDRML